MANLLHWDIAVEFGHIEASALIAGIDPADVAEYWKITMPISQRMEHCYLNARSVVANVQRQHGSIADYEKNLTPAELLSQALMMRVSHPKSGEDEWLNDPKLFDFNEQKFARDELARWLSAIKFKSVYKFQLEQTNMTNKFGPEQDNISLTVIEHELDPEDLPEELDAANVAFRAVFNGYGDQKATPRNRLIDFLKMSYPHLNTEARQRIATVANPDKARGRKSLNKK